MKLKQNLNLEKEIANGFKKKMVIDGHEVYIGIFGLGVRKTGMGWVAMINYTKYGDYVHGAAISDIKGMEKMLVIQIRATIKKINQKNA